MWNEALAKKVKPIIRSVGHTVHNSRSLSCADHLQRKYSSDVNAGIRMPLVYIISLAYTHFLTRL